MNYGTMELWNYGTMNICISLEIFNLFLYFVILLLHKSLLFSPYKI
jgi:hypothetical protein